jgi:FtsZ-binding cell division protein ZapB
MSELIANVTANFYHTDHPLRHWDRTCPACQHAPADGLPERYIQNGRAMISAFCPETGIPKGDWIRAADYDALCARLQEAASRAAALQKELDWFRARNEQCNEARAKLLDDAERLQKELEAVRKDAEQGWNAFYALRKQVAADKYPTLTNVVRLAALSKESK